MKVIDVKEDPKRGIGPAVEVLAAGGIVVYPTDTLYGFGVNAKDKEAVRRLREVKERARGLVFSVMVPDVGELTSLVKVDIDFAPALKLLPGPYTFIFPSKVRLPHGVIGKGLGLGVRVPDHPVALGIARGFGGPVITTSVNRTGEPALTDPEDIGEVFGDKIDLFLDEGRVAGNPSTIVSFMTHPPQVVRRGAGSIDFLETMT
jgi:tRNA threonylcarbamoyl adenosine modification protein (Sua5/YciO/YrdC/YwlC family)